MPLICCLVSSGELLSCCAVTFLPLPTRHTHTHTHTLLDGSTKSSREDSNVVMKWSEGGLKLLVFTWTLCWDLPQSAVELHPGIPGSTISSHKIVFVE